MSTLRLPRLMSLWRNTGSRCGLSILITSAPNSAMVRPQVGPASTMHRSTTFTPCSAARSTSPPACVFAGLAAASSFRISARCASVFGRGERTDPDVSDKRELMPGPRNFPSSGSSKSAMIFDSSACGCFSHSALVWRITPSEPISATMSSHSFAVRVRITSSNFWASSFAGNLASRHLSMPMALMKASNFLLFATYMNQRPSLQGSCRLQLKSGSSSGLPFTSRPRAPTTVNVASNSGISTRCPTPERARAFSAMATVTAQRNAPYADP